MSGDAWSGGEGLRFHALDEGAARAWSAWIQTLVEGELLTPSEVAVAARIARVVKPRGAELDNHVFLALALTLRAERLGSSMVDLGEARLDVVRALEDAVDDGPLYDGPLYDGPLYDADLAPPRDVPSWCERLRAAGALVWTPPARWALSEGVPAPLVLEGDHLWSTRSWLAEQRVAHGVARLRERADGRDVLQDADGWSRVVSHVLALIDGEGAEQQRRAIDGIVGGRLHLLTGGPGTGKTYTLRGMITLAWLHRRASQREGVVRFDVRLAAPTGKAAARMRESLQSDLDMWISGVRDALHKAMGSEDPRASAWAHELETFLGGLGAQTLHRLLGFQSFNSTRFRRGSRAPIPADIVIVDESSMVDLSMMANLFDAVSDDASLVLVGDRRQLASVQAGTVFADMCRAGDAPGLTLRELTVSRRFDDASVVGRFAGGIARLDQSLPLGLGADARALVELLSDESGAEGGAARGGVRWLDGDEGLNTALDEVAAVWLELMVRLAGATYRCEGGVLSLEGSDDAHAQLWRDLSADLERVRMLAVHRKGERGVAGLNTEIWRRIQRGASQRGVTRVTGTSLREPGVGKPLIVRKNDYELGRFNGDVGVWAYVRPRASGDRVLMALFQGADGRVDAHAPSALREYDAVWSTTVHTSQGSEFERVYFVLPDRCTPLMTRELLYTGITRVREDLVVVGEGAVMVDGLVQSIERVSGLEARLIRALPRSGRGEK